MKNKLFNNNDINNYRLVLSFDQIFNEYYSYIIINDEKIDNKVLSIKLSETININNNIIIWYILYYDFIRNNINKTHINEYSNINYSKYVKLKFSTKKNMIENAKYIKFILSHKINSI